MDLFEKIKLIIETQGYIPFDIGNVKKSFTGPFLTPKGAFLRLVVEGDNGTKGYVRVVIPKDLLWTESGWNVTVSGTPVNYTETSYGNYTYLYFAHNHSTKTIAIHGTNVIPEFPSLIISPLFMTVTLLAAMVYRKRRLES